MKRNLRPWTKDELALLGALPDAEVAELTGRTFGTVWQKRRTVGIDQPALSRLENGHTPNPTLDTLWRYAAALGKRLVLSAQDVADTRSAVGRAVSKKAAARKKNTA